MARPPLIPALPLFHRLAGRPILLLGSGEAAEAKRRLIEEAGGIIVDKASPDVRLAFVALEEGAEEAAQKLRAAGLLVNVVDRPDLCDFTVPAIVERSPLLLAVGTDGASASLAKAIKERLERLLPSGLGQLANAIRAARNSVSGYLPTVPARRAFWSRLLAEGGPLDPLRDHDDPAAIIAAQLKAPSPAQRKRLLVIDYATPFDPEDLTLRQLRALAQADLLLHPADAPASLIALARRDCARQSGDGPPENADGLVVRLRPASTQEGLPDDR